MSKRSLRCLLLMILSAGCGQCERMRSHTPRLRVVQGWSALENEYPFVVSLMASLETLPKTIHATSFPTFLRMCTGSLVNSQFVITAAHCIKPQVRYVRCGNMSVSLNETICKSKILRKFRHPGYLLMAHNDIGLLQVQPLVMKHYGVLQGVDHHTLFGRAVRYAGYGTMVYSKKKEKVDKNDINEIIKHQTKPLQIGEGVICGTYNEDSFPSKPLLLVAPRCSRRDQHPFYGDSGGPLFVGGQITGVLCGSSDKTNKRPYPLVTSFTPVSPYLEWISMTINKYEKD